MFPFMATTLGLRGYAKEIFALIFNFWIAAGEKPVHASLSVLQRITGGTRPTVVKAIQFLEEQGFVKAEKHKGKFTMYDISIDSSIVTEFKSTYHSSLGKEINQMRLNFNTGSGQNALPQKLKEYGKKTDTTLRVRERNQINTGGLPEVQ